MTGKHRAALDEFGMPPTFLTWVRAWWHCANHGHTDTSAQHCERCGRRFE